MSGQLRPRDEMMRDCSKNRAGFDRVLMAVAATFLTVSAILCTGADRSVPQQRRRTCDRCRNPAPRTRQCPASDRQRFQAGRRQDRRIRARTGKDNGEARRDQEVRCRCRAGRRSRQAGHAPRSNPRRTGKAAPAQNDTAKNDPAAAARPPRLQPPLRQRRPLSPPRSRPRPPATCRRRTSRSPTDCATSGSEILALFRPQGRTECGRRNSTTRANLLHCGPRAAH